MSTERLAEFIQSTYGKWLENPRGNSWQRDLAEKLEGAGVTLPPEPEILVPDEALKAYRAAADHYRGRPYNWVVTEDSIAELRACLRACYPIMVAAMIDALERWPGSDRDLVDVSAYAVSRESLHRALRSSKAQP